MTACEQTVVSLFRVMQNSSDLFSLIANSGAPRARGAPFLRKFGNLSIREVLHYLSLSDIHVMVQ